MGVHEYLMTFDEPRQRPEPHKKSPEDHTRRDWILYEREQLAKADNQPHLRTDVLCYTAEMKHANEFWRQILVSKIDALFFTERPKDYDENDDHKKRVEQLNAAKRDAGYPVYPTR
jgi:hypothetical protein